MGSISGSQVSQRSDTNLEKTCEYGMYSVYGQSLCILCVLIIQEFIANRHNQTFDYHTS